MPGTTVWEVSGQHLFGKDTRPAGAPRATIVALHGGGSSASYWDHPLDPAASLLTLGPALGYRVVAIDRPAAPCSRHRRESSSPGSGPAVTTSACTTSPAPTTCAPSRSSTRRS